MVAEGKVKYAVGETILGLNQGINVYCSIVFFYMVYALTLNCICLVSISIIVRLGIYALSV